MAKRGPDLQLTHDNWNDELPLEEAGSFNMASAEEIDKRVMKKAKRRLNEREGAGGGSSVFANFSGFGKSSSSNGKLFEFLATSKKAVETPSKPDSEQLRRDPLESKTPTQFTYNSTTGTSNLECGGHLSAGSLSASKTSSLSKSRFEYLQKLRKLNEDFVTWVKGHFDKNPYLDLTPVFNDYSEHLKMLEDKYQDNSTPRKQSAIAQPPPTTTPQQQQSLPALNIAKPSEISGPQSTNITSSSINVVKIQQSEQTVASKVEEEEDVECKAEVKVIEEENTSYKTRCKLFYMKEGNYVEKGIGTLYIKLMDNNKTSLLIRAETSLGTILLNILLTPSIPVQRVGKNNLSLVCVPFPPLNAKSEDGPVSFLIRVKNEEVADELFKHLEKAKND